MRVLVTGGAGFIGSQVVASLAAEGHTPVVLDALLPAAHPCTPELPEAEFVRGDVRDAHAVSRALRGVDAVCHQAAMVGLGKDFADAPEYVACNDLGTAVLLAGMAEAQVRRFVQAGSMVVYGEGRYECREHGAVRPGPRAAVDLAAGSFEPRCPHCGAQLVPGLVNEDAPTDPRNVYATTKLAQEHLAAAWARSAAWARPYRCVTTTCTARGCRGTLRTRVWPRSSGRHWPAGEAPRVFEDGAQRRDFVHVRDVARANVSVLAGIEDMPAGGHRAYNVGSGDPRTVGEMAAVLAAEHGGLGLRW